MINPCAELNIFNSFNNKMLFTIEEDTNQSVPYLDTNVIRKNNNKIILDRYQKDTASGRFLNFYSNHPKNQKFNTVIAMKNRITHISHPSFLNTNLKTLFNIFVNNGYPKKVLNKLIYNTNFYDGLTEDQPPGLLIYKKIPYVTNLTDTVIKLFKSFSNIKIAKYNQKN